MSKPLHVVTDNEEQAVQSPRRGRRQGRAQDAAERPTSRLLIDESPLQFQPSLAVAIGLNEAIVLQQLQWRLGYSQNEHDGHLWVYDSYPAWQKEFFPFWSVATVTRTFLKLEELGVIVSGQLNKENWDQRKWYRLDYDRLEELRRSINQQG